MSPLKPIECICEISFPFSSCTSLAEPEDQYVVAQKGKFLDASSDLRPCRWRPAATCIWDSIYSALRL
jgi:hypothetical protein